MSMRDESHSKKNYSVGNESQNCVITTTVTFLLIRLDLNVISKYPHLTRDTNVLRDRFIQRNHTLKY